MPRILFAGTDAATIQGLKPLLVGGYEVSERRRGEEVLAALRHEGADVLLVDGDLTDMPGMTLLRFLRETPLGHSLPVIYLAPRKTSESVAQAFELGVDDYLAKPCDPREIMMRVNVVLRRRREHALPWSPDLTVSGIRLEPSQRRCFIDGKSVHLRPLEFSLLELLMKKAGRVLTRPYLLATLWGIDAEVDTRSVDASVARLRRALGKRRGKMIQTISKMGYCLRAGGR